MKVLVTCPPMLRSIDKFRSRFEEKGIELVLPEVVQTLTVPELLELVPTVDGWIIGDDPAKREVFEAGVKGNLKAAVKWGVGVDNVDFEACKDLGIPITNTPGMFGGEVADVAISLMLGLTRHTFFIDRSIREGKWLKPAGMSLDNKTVAVVGLGDIGKNTAKRLNGFGVKINGYDPYVKSYDTSYINLVPFPERLEEADIVILTSALTKETHHLINESTINQMKDGILIVNVSRGPLIDEPALVTALKSGKVAGAGLDVFEQEPATLTNPLIGLDNCVFGSHNGSNTREGVVRASEQAIQYMFEFLKIA